MPLFRCCLIFAFLFLLSPFLKGSSKRIHRDKERTAPPDKEMVFPASGFFRAKDESNRPLSSKIMTKHRQQIFCNRIKFINLPEPNASPLVNGEYFDLIPEESFHGKLTYYNGHEYLSYIPTEGDDSKGTWLVGNEPGIDNGFVFLKPSELTISPIGLESNSTKWHWLQGKEWVLQDKTKVICADDDDEVEGGGSSSNRNKVDSKLSTFYTIEYVKEGSSEFIRGTLFPISKSILEANFAKHFSIPEDYNLNLFDAVIINLDNDNWEPLKNIKEMMAIGEPYLIISKSNIDNIDNLDDSKGKVGYLVSEEQSGNSGWRLTFRYLFNSSDTSQDHINVIGTSDNLYPEYFDSAPSERTKRIKSLMEYRKDDEVIIEYDGYGFKNFKVQNLDKKLASYYLTKSTNTIDTAKVGEYVWIWHSSTDDNNSDDDDNNDSKKSKRLSFDMIDQLLLQCVLSTETVVIFKFFESNRIETMHRTVLDSDTQFAIYYRNRTDANPTSKQQLDLLVRDKNVKVHGAMSLGPNVINFLLSYLYHKDSALGGISSCYLYHGAVSLPRALVYAAEIVCVLLGAKPVTLIQYTTPSDHQWKFPLVRELVASISQAKVVLGNKIDIDFETFVYGKDESLVIYRSSSKYMAHSLRPFKQAQALHPAPYPDQDGRPNEVTKDWKAQIFYAWWNGYILGYPENFVDSYCQNFHNGLTHEDKEAEIAKARLETKEYFRELQHYNSNFKRCIEIKNDVSSCSREIGSSRIGGVDDEISRNIKAIVEGSYSGIMRANPNPLKFEHKYIGFDNIDGPLIGDFWKFINY